MARVERTAPAYAQIADHYRERIRNGLLAAGDRLPSISEIAEEWGVARATAAQAISRLQVEHAVHTSTQGTFVSADEVIAPTPGDRIRSPLPQRTVPGETIEVTSVSIVVAPDYVAELLNIPPGTEVVRREEITSQHGHPRMLAVDWIPAPNTLVALGVLDDQPLEGGPAHFLETVAHRKVTHAQDHLEGRSADAREASALKVPIGAPVLAGVHVWSDSDDVILYGEWVMPARRVVTYTYEVTS